MKFPRCEISRRGAVQLLGVERNEARMLDLDDVRWELESGANRGCDVRSQCAVRRWAP
jgi:hypothetical protein